MLDMSLSKVTFLKSRPLTFPSRTFLLSKRHFSASTKSCQDFSELEKIPLKDVKQDFAQYEGGSVTLTSADRGHARISFENAGKKNAISGRMMVQLNDIARELEAEQDALKSWSLVSEDSPGNSGRKKVFCAGGDMTTVAKICHPDFGYLMARLMHDTVVRLRSLPLLSAALVDGRGLGGGAELPLFADFRVFTGHASLAFIEANVGVSTGWGGGKLLTDIVGPARALNCLLSCRKIGAEEALSVGLCDVIAEDEEDKIRALDDLISEMCERHQPEIVKAARSIVHSGVSAPGSLAEALRRERQHFAPLWGGPANLKVLEKVLKKT